MKSRSKKLWNRFTKTQVPATVIFATFIISLFFVSGINFGEKQNQIVPAEVSYKAISPVGKAGGIALPASCDSGTWNNNSGYHLTAPYTDPGNCVPPSYNCESGIMNPGLSITTDHSIAVRLSSAMRWFNNRFFNSCYYNSSGTDYFVPTNTQTEKDAFNAHLPSGVTRGGF